MSDLQLKFTNGMFEVVNDIRFHLDPCHSISTRRKQASACLPCRGSPLKIPSPILQFCPSGPDRHPKAVRRSPDRESLERAAKEVLFNDSNMLMLTLWRRNKSQISFRYLFANIEDSSLQFRGWEVKRYKWQCRDSSYAAISHNMTQLILTSQHVIDIYLYPFAINISYVFNQFSLLDGR